MTIQEVFRNISKLALDTAPIIYFVEKHPKYHLYVSAVSASITLTEVLNHPLRQGATRIVQEYEDILENSRGFELIPIDNVIARTAATLRVKYHLKTPDAL